MKTKFGARLFLSALCVAAPAALQAEDGPVALYHFDEGTGDVVHDSSPYHNDGRAIGGSAWAAKGVSGTAFLLDGRNRVEVPSGNRIDLKGPHSISAWIRGRPSSLHWAQGFPEIDALYFQVCGDTIYAASFSDAVNHVDRSKLPTLRGDDIPHIYTGTIDLSLGRWQFTRRTIAPYSGFEPKMEVVGDKIYLEYTGRDRAKVEQIWTSVSARDGSDYQVRQRTSEVARVSDLPPDRPEVGDSKRVGDAIYRVDHGAVAVAGGRAYLAYPAQDDHNVWQFTTAICDGDRTETVRRTSDHGFIPSGIQVAGDRVYYLFPMGDDAFESYSHAVIKGSNPGLKTVAGIYLASTDRAGRDWKIVQKVAGPCPAGNPASFQVSDGQIYVIWAQLDPRGGGHSKLFTGAMDLDGGHFQKWQRTFENGFVGTSIAGGVQVVGDRIYYVFNQRVTDATYAELGRPGSAQSRFGGWALWTAECKRDGSGWSAQRAPGPSSLLVGYKGLVVEGAKRYLAPLDASDLSHLPAFGHGPGLLGSDGANIVGKGDAYGLGVTAAGRARGFVNAGQDYLFRGDGSVATAGAIADADAALAGDRWYHLAEVYDGRGLDLYINGDLTARAPMAAPPASNPFPLVIGDGFLGAVDEVAVYDRALSSPEVQKLYRQFR